MILGTDNRTPSRLDATIAYTELFKGTLCIVDTIRAIAKKSEIKCDGYQSFFEASIHRVESMQKLLRNLIEQSENRETFNYDLIWQSGNVALDAFKAWESSHTVRDFDLIEGLRWELSNLYLLETNFRGLIR